MEKERQTQKRHHAEISGAILLLTLTLLCASVALFDRHRLITYILCLFLAEAGFVGYAFFSNSFCLNIVNIALLFMKHFFIKLLVPVAEIDYTLVYVIYLHYLSIGAFEFFAFRHELGDTPASTGNAVAQTDTMCSDIVLRTYYQHYCNVFHMVLVLHPFENSAFAALEGRQTRLYLSLVLWALLTSLETFKNYKGQRVLLIASPVAKCSMLFNLPPVSAALFWLAVLLIVVGDLLILRYQFRHELRGNSNTTWRSFFFMYEKLET